MQKVLVLLLMNLAALCGAYAQQIRGTVTHEATDESIPAASIVVKGAQHGTYTDDRGRFQLQVSKLPVTLVISSIGFETREVEVKLAGEGVGVKLSPASALGQEVVVSASRTTQKKLASPVTIEKLSAKDIANSPQLNYIDMIQGLKGVDVTVSSLGFTSITTRGFNTSGNTNFTQKLWMGWTIRLPGSTFRWDRPLVLPSWILQPLKC